MPGRATDRLTAHGHRCLAPNQHGYSPGARPTRRRNYRATELIEDVRALIDSAGAERIHLVGHDWGAAVAWGVADELSESVATLTSFSVPHPTAFLKGWVTSRQGLLSWTCTSSNCRGCRSDCCSGRTARAPARSRPCS